MSSDERNIQRPLCADMSKLGLIPIALVVLTVSAFVLSYIWAVVRGDVSPGFPYIR